MCVLGPDQLLSVVCIIVGFADSFDVFVHVITTTNPLACICLIKLLQ